MPTITGVLESALYVDDLDRARGFYEAVLGLRAMFSDDKMSAYDVGGRSVLLLFQRRASLETAHLPGGTIPPHDGNGPLHLALAIPASALAAWEERLSQADVAIEGRTDWPRGGHSLFFRDPDGHLLELATPGLWPTY